MPPRAKMVNGHTATPEWLLTGSPPAAPICRATTFYDDLRAEDYLERMRTHTRSLGSAIRTGSVVLLAIACVGLLVFLAITRNEAKTPNISASDQTQTSPPTTAPLGSVQPPSKSTK